MAILTSVFLSNDSEVGRFGVVDALWQDYLSISPYAYALNNPVNAKDIDGRDAFVLLDKEGANGAGHIGVLIGRDYDKKTGEGGWHLYSKNGGEYKIAGKSIEPQIGGNQSSYLTLKDFYADLDKNQTRYDVGLMFTTSPNQDALMRSAAKDQVLDNYNLLSNSCNNTFTAMFDKLNEQSNNILIQPGRSAIPNVSFYQMYHWNKYSDYKGELIDINNERGR